MRHSHGSIAIRIWLSAALLAVFVSGCAKVDRSKSRPKRSEMAAEYIASRIAGGGQPASAPQSAQAPVGEMETYPVDLPTALRLADADNYQIALAREKISEASAQYEGAKVLLLPSLNIGASFHRHDGELQETDGNVIDTRRTSRYVGLGAGAVGAGAPQIPGLSISADLATAIFAPLAARQQELAAEAGDRAVTNQTLLDVANTYYELSRAQAALAIAGETRDNAANLAEVTASFADAGEGLDSDAERAAVEQLLWDNELEAAREVFQVQSARLAKLLRLDPRVQLVPIEENIMPIEIISADRSLDGLISDALMEHPELDEKQALANLALQRNRQAKFSPLLPKIGLGYSAGYFGGRNRQQNTNNGSRNDLDAVLYWQVLNFGVGNRAKMREQRSLRRQAELEQFDAIDRIASEVVQAHAQVQAREKQIDIGAEAVGRAMSSLDLNLTRIYQGQGLPIEVLQAIQSLATTRQLYLDNVIDYNQAQFRLYTALGQPASEAAAPQTETAQVMRPVTPAPE